MVYQAVGITGVDGYTAAILCEHLQNCKEHKIWTAIQPNSTQYNFWEYSDGRNLDHVNQFIDFRDFVEIAQLLWAIKYNISDLQVLKKSFNCELGCFITRLQAEFWLSASINYTFEFDCYTYMDSMVKAHMLRNFESIQCLYMTSRDSYGVIDFCNLEESPVITRLAEQLAGDPKVLVASLNENYMSWAKLYQEKIIAKIEATT